MDSLPSATAAARPTPDVARDTPQHPTPPQHAEDPAARAWRETDQDASTLNAGTAPGRAEDLPTIGHVGRYALKHLLGSGGLGTVHAAHDPLLSRLIAIKTLKVDSDQRKNFDANFLNEARAAAGLSHPHIVTVFDAGVSEQGPYIAMELLKGRDLRQLREEGWRPTPDQAATIVRRVADALAYAHAKGVVHRDIKPANIFMVSRTQPRVLDFGIARIANGSALSEAELPTAGSPFYMAPEQVRGEPVDRRADVFSLGVVFYELLCGTKPFRGRTLAEIQHGLLKVDPPPPHTLDRSVPSALSAIVARAMQKNPDQRYRSARRMASDLRQWLEEHTQTDPAGEVSPLTRARRAPASRLPVWWPAAAGVGVAVLGTGGWWIGRASVPELPSAIPPAVIAQAAAIAAGLPIYSPGAVLPAGLSAPSADAVSVATTPGSEAGTGAGAMLPPTEDPTLTTETLSDVGSAAAAAKPRAPRKAERRKVPVVVAPEPAAASPAKGLLRLAVSPWGEVEVDGRAAGVTPPLSQLELPAGPHTITIRNADFPPHVVTVTVDGDQPVTLRHRF